jgi:hypothetical protein
MSKFIINRYHGCLVNYLNKNPFIVGDLLFGGEKAASLRHRH